MMLDEHWQIFLVGLTGGGLLELLHWYNILRTPQGNEYSCSAKYWISSFLMAGAGGLLALFYFRGEIQAIIPLHVGLSTPLILQKLATTAAEPPGARGPRVSLISFFRW